VKTRTTWAAVAAVLATAPACPLQAADDENPGLTELVQILRNQGVLDEAQYEQISAKATAQEKKESWFDRITLSGDTRIRFEGFYYDHDSTGNEHKDRNRWRYRLRLKGRAEVNDHVQAIFRLVSGTNDNRSTNRTLGDAADFDSDPIEIDWAYLRLTPFANGEIPGTDGTLALEAGKMPNPFVWKQGKDFLLWDHDISPEGIQIVSSLDVTNDLELFSNAAWYVIDENSSSRDPQMLGVQGGGRLAITDTLSLGSRLTWYHFMDLDDAFFERATDSSLSSSSVTDGGGNLGRTLSGGNGIFDVVETSGYLSLDALEAWPLTLFWTYSNNVGAESSPGAGKNNEAWMVGAQVGDKKEWVMLGALYAEIEANAFPSMFIDSDLFDGRTNRKGWAIYAARQIWKNTDFKLTTFISDDIHGAVPPYDFSAPNADRVRLQADVEVKF
jgi:hypothetical protein